KERGDSELKEITMEAFEEHAQMKKFLQEINRASTTKEKREAKLKVLIEDTRHHVKEEEGEMFSMVEDQFSDEELDALGDRMEAEKLKFQKAKGIAPRKEEAPTTVGVLLEKAKNVVSSITGSDGSSEASDDGSGEKSRGRKSSASRTSTARGRTNAAAGKA
ncbi:MAG: hemerythrin domain-containing protein, partial [Pyrinomonadaceae bacterium]